MGEVAPEIEMQSNNASAESERFPPPMILSLRVLLVEADDSTRQIIAALLRKCGYKVAAVRDGLKAWEALKNNASDIDLVLTEVDLPSISGFSLLTLVMEHDTCKNIPVLMMSSQDSISTVFKCMLKGAVDFLVKPVRRNELRNLWQHVWRRHAISKPPQNLTSLQNKLDVAAENIAASNNSIGSVASTQKNNECHQKTSEAQSTCTSPFLEAESTYMEIMQDTSQLKSSSNLSNTGMEEHNNSTKIGRESPKHNYEAGVIAEKSTVLVSEAAWCDKTSAGLRLGQGNDHSETENQDEVIKTELCEASSHINAEIHRCNELVEPSTPGAIDLIAKFENLPKSTDENLSFNGGNTTKYDFDTQLELSLRRDFPGSSCTPATEENQILNHSNASAFSWYSSNKLLHPLFPTNDSHELCKLSKNTSTYHQYDGKNQNEENITNLVIGRFGQVEATVATSDSKSMGRDNDLHSMVDTQSAWTQKSVCQKECSPIPSNTSSQSNPKSENHHWSDDATYTFNQKVNDKSNTECSMYGSPAADLSSGVSFLHDAENHNSNSICGGIGSGSDGNATSAVVGNNHLESSTDNNNFDGHGGTKSGVNNQREAALTKFRLKRKDRCYEKKVRYESRKRLAEQRPRVKGQFVRRVADAGCS